ncbi:hypothetical protein JOC75_002817 [Metabacillus crassostreae]|nr:hypothetical protein [Metabacillus crassostreae]
MISSFLYGGGHVELVWWDADACVSFFVEKLIYSGKQQIKEPE